MALALLVLALVGVPLMGAFVLGFQGFARAAWGGAGSGQAALSLVPEVVRPLSLLIGMVAIAVLVCVVAQRAPTLGSAAAGSGARQERRGRGRPRGRLLFGVMAGFKAVVLAMSLAALAYDSLAGWLDGYARSAGELLEISGRVLPAVLLRAAWVCLLLGGLELVVQQVARLRRLRMTRQEVQDEQRELAGDPRLLAERRSRATLSPQVVAADLAQLEAAALLITGSSRVVALEYSPEHGVPRVWLSAQGPHALELVSRAYALELPIVTDDLLALGLFRTPLRAAVPAEWHARVAQLLVAHAKPVVREAS